MRIVDNLMARMRRRAPAQQTDAPVPHNPRSARAPAPPAAVDTLAPQAQHGRATHAFASGLELPGAHAARLAADWRALRRMESTSVKGMLRQSAKLDGMLEALPVAARLNYLVELAVYIIQHAPSRQGDSFVAVDLLSQLRRRVFPSEGEYSDMFSFACDFDARLPFTETTLAGGPGSMDTYEGQLRDIGESAFASLLGYLYLRDFRAAGGTWSTCWDDAFMREAVGRYAHLHRTEFCRTHG